MIAEIDASVATALIRTWRLKLDVGFWRPFGAVAGAADDHNSATTPETGWASLVPTRWRTATTSATPLPDG